MPPEILYGTLIVLAAAFVQACTGFGFAMISAPLLLLLLPYGQIPALVVMLSLVNNVLTLLMARGGLRFGLVGRLLLGALPGLPLGVLVLWSFNLDVFRVLLGALVAFTALALLKGWRTNWGRSPAGTLGAGFLSGLLSTASSLSGPPVILSLANHDLEKDQFRANLLAYFGLLNVLTIATFLIFGIFARTAEQAPITPESARLWLYLLPALLTGTLLGVAFIRRVREGPFRRGVLLLLIVLGVSIAASGLV